jgi:hypothetical protein
MFITISAVGYFQGDEIVYFDRIKDEVIILVLEKERKAKYRQKNQDLLPKLIQSIEWNKAAIVTQRTLSNLNQRMKI